MERNVSLDILKLAMAFMVVALHCEFLSDVSPLYSYLTMNGLFRIAVPIFLIINGFYFYPVIAKQNHAVWFKKVLILYTVWMLIYAKYWVKLPEFSSTTIANIVFEFLIGFHHLWYITGMLGAAFIVLLAKNIKTSTLILYLTITYLAGVVIQYTGSYHLAQQIYLDQLLSQHWSHRNFLLFSFPFFGVGYLINKLSLHQSISMQSASLLSAAGLMLLFIESYLNFYQPTRMGGFDNYASLILVCPAIFILFKNISIFGQSKTIASYSSAIYFIHMIFIMGFVKFLHFNTLQLTTAVIISSIAASFFVIKANEKLKFLL